MVIGNGYFVELRNACKMSKCLFQVVVGRQGSCAQYGMVAVQDIAEGYCLFQVPRKCLLMPENSRIADSLKTGDCLLMLEHASLCRQ